MADVLGQAMAKRALEIAAAWGAQHPADRAARLGEEHAGEAVPVDFARPHL